MKLGLALVFAASTAHGQEMFVDESAVRACYAEVRLGDAVPTCVGAAAKACHKLPGGETTLGITECLMAETSVWAELMQVAYAKQFEALGNEGRALETQLAAAQDAWALYRDAECGLRYGYWIDGSIRTVIAAACRLDKTAARVQELGNLGVME